MLSSELPPPKLLLVKGQDDEHVVRHLCNKLEPSPEVVCRDKFVCQVKDNDDQVLKAITTEMKVDGRLALGIMMDADDNLAARWQAISDKLRKVNVQLPEQRAPGGTIVEGAPRVGVWLMPNNSTEGELENFVAKLLPKDDPVWPLAKQYIDGIPGQHRQFSRKKELRAKLHAWLATRREPRKMGAAIRTGELDAGAPLAVQFVDWLRALFGPGAMPSA